jgi:hypothetical protein
LNSRLEIKHNEVVTLQGHFVRLKDGLTRLREVHHTGVKHQIMCIY